MIVLCDKSKHYIGQPFTPDIEVIASALSNINRYTGHVGQYSVAQHSVYACRMAPDELKLSALLHDATEAYLGDVSAPLKAYLPAYRDLEKHYHATIDEHFMVDTTNLSVKEIDLRLLVTEALIFGVWTPEYPDAEIYKDCDLPDLYLDVRWSPLRAQAEFMREYNLAISARAKAA